VNEDVEERFSTPKFRNRISVREDFSEEQKQNTPCVIGGRIDEEEKVDSENNRQYKQNKFNQYGFDLKIDTIEKAKEVFGDTGYLSEISFKEPINPDFLLLQSFFDSEESIWKQVCTSDIVKVFKFRDGDTPIILIKADAILHGIT
jgi:hypothetical protein